MDDNPYRPPVAELQPPLGHGSELASRGARFGAALIDAIVVGGVNGIVLWQLGLWDELMRQPDDVGLLAGSSALGIGIWLVIQLAFLRVGQTLGKWIVGIRMVDFDTGGPVPLGRLILVRYLPVQVVAAIPIIGRILPIVDVLFIFSADQRCVHDHLAGTKVVQV
jgi:uncharacterized RDD family membrane protein YckC